ncbi:MarR family protein [Acetitomaculum ruminis DSM 5522]|uniref:MarR family protein n=1 Tax=Acetitomaculum ruminis DSM 5522 TaxID=1120918 RepID=A0A1I0ZBX2_9FIRM|nr:methyltransferase domain-containing protein [Acetitomaculum ruminis]SFB23021.1 MarR family protein [Acetitomaculum ruminis DSM 5522]
MNKTIKEFWDYRAKSYGVLRSEHLNSSNFTFWKQELESNFPPGKRLRVLDIGTSTGFMAIAAASLGHHVYAIDISDKMIEEAKKASKNFLENDKLTFIHFKVMDAEALEYEDDYFDAVISRNTTWTLCDVKKTYEEAFRVLKPGGVFLNYDADYGKISFYNNFLETHDSKDIQDKEFVKYCKLSDEYKSQLPISFVSRPQWDVTVLRSLGFAHCEYETDISSKFNPHGNIGNKRSDMFFIYAVKPISRQSDSENVYMKIFMQHLFLKKREERFYANFFEKSNIPMSHFLVLLLLMEHEEGLRPSDISDYLLIPRQSITRIISSFIDNHYVKAIKNSKDARSFLAVITKKGKNYANHLFEQVSPSQIKAIDYCGVENWKEANKFYKNFLDYIENC